jgi:hypothetical protein
MEEEEIATDDAEEEKRWMEQEETQKCCQRIGRRIRRNEMLEKCQKGEEEEMAKTEGEIEESNGVECSYNSVVRKNGKGNK